MPYSKRWELIHLLGGKCFDCGNGNFYELEIDHINNDGDGERKYYTQSEKNYLDNPRKAKERLAVRCKICHEKRHHPNIILDTLEVRNVSIWPSHKGVPLGYGTMLGDIDQLIIGDCQNTNKIQTIIQIVDISNNKFPMPKISKAVLFMEVFKKLEEDGRLRVKEETLIKELENTGDFPGGEARNQFKKMLIEASIYESAPGSYNRV